MTQVHINVLIHFILPGKQRVENEDQLMGGRKWSEYEIVGPGTPFETIPSISSLKSIIMC